MVGFQTSYAPIGVCEGGRLSCIQERHKEATSGQGLRGLLFMHCKAPDTSRLHAQVPVTFIYGDGDWMEPAAGQRVARAVLQHRGRLSPTDGQVHSSLCS